MPRLELVAIDFAVEGGADVLQLTSVLHERVLDPSELGIHVVIAFSIAALAQS